MNKILFTIGLITAVAGGVQAQINSYYFINCEIEKVISIENGIEQVQHIYHHDDTGKIQVLFDAVNNEKPYVRAVYQCSPGSISETLLHSSGEVAEEALYTIDKEGRIIRKESTVYEAWDDVITEVTYHRIVEYDQRGNRVSVEASNSNGWSISAKYSYDDDGRLKKITTYNSQNEVSEKLFVYTSENSYYIEPSYDSFFRFLIKNRSKRPSLYTPNRQKKVSPRNIPNITAAKSWWERRSKNG